MKGGKKIVHGKRGKKKSTGNKQRKEKRKGKGD